jgi:hypothetical protein
MAPLWVAFEEVGHDSDAAAEDEILRRFCSAQKLGFDARESPHGSGTIAFW